MPREAEPRDTTREAAFALWMNAPNPMVTFFKTFDVTNLVKNSRKRDLKFNMLMDHCIGKAAAGVREFYLLPVGNKLIRYDTLAVSFQFHHTQMDGAHAGKFLADLQGCINSL